jgi:hypothetical protein
MAMLLSLYRGDVRAPFMLRVLAFALVGCMIVAQSAYALGGDLDTSFGENDAEPCFRASSTAAVPAQSKPGQSQHNFPAATSPS